jgi:hypothetical protein
VAVPMLTVESHAGRTTVTPWEASPFIGRPETIVGDPARTHSVLIAHAHVRPAGGIVRTPALTSIGGIVAAIVVVRSSSAVSVFGPGPDATTYFAWTAPGSAIRTTARGVQRVTSGAAVSSCAVEEWSAATTLDASAPEALAELRQVVTAIRRRVRFIFSDELRSLLRQAADAHAS